MPLCLCAEAADYVAGTPYTYLFDTNASSSEPLSPQVLAAKTGWTLLAEDDLTHKFHGDAVMLNDKLAVVLRNQGSGSEVYSQTPAGLKFRARLTPLRAIGDPAAVLASLATHQNSPASVAITAVFKTAAADRLALGYGITTGQRIVELRPGEGTGRLLVSAGIRYLVVPDFFADDMVFGPEAFDRPRLEMPTENMLLNLLEGGDAMLMCLWRSGRQGAAAVLSGGPLEKTIGGCEVQCAKDASLWVALMEGAGIWHEQAPPGKGRKTEMVVDWKPPFSARWRADFVPRVGLARSWDLLGPAQADEASPALAQPDCPCRFEGDRAKLDGDPGGPLVIYPLDRSRATPLTTFCPVDMLRNTLGVGPCQYILQTEGLATETNPTPDQVMSFVEKQFEKKKEMKAAEQIKDLLKQMVEQVGQTQARIDQYGDFARQIRGLCAAQGRAENTSPLPPGKNLSPLPPGQNLSPLPPGQNLPPLPPGQNLPPLPPGEGRGEGALQTIDRIAGSMEEAITPASGAAELKNNAGKLAGEVAGLIGKENSLAECQRLGAELRRIGAVQDRTLSKCRMATRWLKQQAMMAEANSAGAALAREVRARADKILQTK